MLLFAGAKILSGYIYDTVGIDIEGNLDLRNTSSCRWDTVQTELAKGLVISWQTVAHPVLRGYLLQSWLSAAVEKIWLFLVGMVVFLSISLVATPPMVSMDRDSGVTSSKQDIACAGIAS